MGNKGITVAGFISRAEEYADPFVFCNLNDKAFGSITAVVDDVPYAKKRLVNPQTIYRYNICDSFVIIDYFSPY